MFLGGGEQKIALTPAQRKADEKKAKRQALKKKLKRAAMGVGAAGLTALAGYGAYKALKKPKNANNNNTITPAQEEIQQAKENKTNNIPPARNQKDYGHQFDAQVNKWKAAQEEIQQAKEDKANDVTPKKRNIRIVKSSKNTGGTFMTPKAVERKRREENKKRNEELSRAKNADVIKRREAEREAAKKQRQADRDLFGKIYDKVDRNTNLRNNLVLSDISDRLDRGLITQDEYDNTLSNLPSRKYDSLKTRILARAAKKGSGRVYKKYVKDYKPLTDEESVHRRYKAKRIGLKVKQKRDEIVKAVQMNRDKIKTAAGKFGDAVSNLGGKLKRAKEERVAVRKRNKIDKAIQKKMNNDPNYVFNSAEDYIDDLLDTMYEAYYYDLLDDAEYEAFVESVYEADDMNEISDIETVFESYIE